MSRKRYDYVAAVAPQIRLDPDRLFTERRLRKVLRKLVREATRMARFKSGFGDEYLFLADRIARELVPAPKRGRK